MSKTLEILRKIFVDPESALPFFDSKDLANLDIYEKSSGKFYLKSFSRGEEEKLVWNETSKKGSPEEIVRQLYINSLIKKYNYPKDKIDIEKSVSFGREKKRADIIVFQDDNTTAHLIVEVKAPNVINDVQQLKSYLNAEGAPIGVALNGQTILILYRPYPKEFDDTLSDIPKFGETIEDVLERRKKISDLEEPKQLQQVIKYMEELVLANSGADSFEEIFKLIYAKLYDEKKSVWDNSRSLEFRKSPSRDADQTKANIEKLFEMAKVEWPGVFEDSDSIKLSAEHLSVCVGELERYKLLGANLQVIDDAFEYLIPAVSKSKKGQYFTPRVIIDLCVDVLQPKLDEHVIDTASGSGGFLIHAMRYVTKDNNLSEAQIQQYASRYLYGIDFDEKSSKIARAMMLIAGDGKSHIFKANSLDSTEWDSRLKNELEDNKLLTRFEDYEKNENNKKTFRNLDFDVLLANPPFSGEVKESKILSQYQLGKKAGKNLKKASRHLLFIEKNLNTVKPGGRLAMVLPQGVLNNTNDEHVRDFLFKEARVLGVVGVERNSFKPFTPTKTSVIFLQKWKEGEDREQDYPIFFGTSSLPFKDSSGNYIYKEVEGKNMLQNDLENIALAFTSWCKEEGLNFISNNPSEKNSKDLVKKHDLKVSVVKKSKLEDHIRLDAEFYQPEALNLRNKLRKNGAKTLGDYVSYVKRGTQPTYDDVGTIKALRSVNVRPEGINDTRQLYVNEDTYRKKKKAQVRKGDVLLTSTGIGTLGRAAFVFENEEYFADGHITILRDIKDVSPEYIYAYLNSESGQVQLNTIHKGSSGQIEIYPEDIENILVPECPDKTQKEIAKLISDFYKKTREAESLFKKAQDLF